MSKPPKAQKKLSPEVPARAALKKARRVVVKVGSSLLTGGGVHPDPRYIGRLAQAVGELWRQGREVCIVTSGAVAAGRGALGFKEKPRTLPERQACAAAGQVALMHLYARAFEKLAPPRAVGQLLLTRDGLEDRQRYLNARHTIEALFACGAVPIVNENDTVSVDEIRFGDNDNLSALVAAAAEAELLVILTDVEGLLEAPPAVNPNAKRIALVAALTPEIEALAKPPESSVGTGGMVTKLQAAKIVTGAGEGMVLCCGRNPEILLEVAAGCDVGTYFMPSGDKLSARKRWLAYTQRAQGTLQVDAGAQAALCQRHKSLLPGGILEVQGNFDSGALVELRGPEGAPFARGLCNYGSAEVERIKGKNTAQAAKELGPLLFDEVVHRDNLVIL